MRIRVKLFITTFLLFSITTKSFASYMDVIFLNYNFFSKLNSQHEYTIPDEFKASFSQHYKANFLGGSISVGKYLSDNILATVEGEISSKYTSNDPLSNFDSITNDPLLNSDSIKFLDYSKIFKIGMIANIYYNFSNSEERNYYVAIGGGLTHINGYKDNINMLPYLAQFKIGIKYPKVFFFSPYIGYKYIYIKEFDNNKRKIYFKGHNLECGIAANL